MNNEINGKTLLSVTASIAAAIIPDTPIVSIAGATLSEITTTTTSTTTTPTPTPVPTSFISSTKANKESITNSSNNPMSDVPVIKSAGGNGNTTANAAAANTTTTSNAPGDAGGNLGKTSFLDHTATVNTATAGKTEEATTNATTIDTKKSDVSDLEEPDLKKLLEEAYTYKTPKDKKDKSEIFLDLLQKVENEDLGITSTRSDSHRHHPHSQSRHQQKQGGSLQDLLQLPSDYRRQNHTSRHKKNSSVSSRQREGGSLPSNVNVANCLLNSFEQQASVYARRAFLLGVESGTATLNSGNSNALGVGGGASGGNNVSNSGLGTISSGNPIANSTNLCNKEIGNSVGANVTSGSGGSVTMATTASGHTVGSTMATGAGIVNTAINTANSIKSTGDYIINIGDMIDIQQQQQILPSKAQDVGQGLPFYERVDIDMRIPRPNLHRGGDVDYAPSRSHHYVDEVIRFHQIDSAENSLCESGEVAISVNTLGNTLKSAAASCSLPMPLDERYRSLKSVMGEKGESTGVNVNSALAAKASGTTLPNSGNPNSITNSNTIGVGGSSSSSSIGIGNYAKSLPLSRQTDENGNDCERQQHSSNNIISSAGQSQAKAKAKKKPQKDNTIPVDVENEAGYRGKDPVEVLVKFIESTEEDNKQSGGGGSNSNKFSENSKKKERKKEKVKQNKIKKSNSLEELRSCAKIDVGELKQSAATTESNNVTMRGKGNGGGGGNKGSKNNSASTADINKNFDGGTKETAATTSNSSKQVNVVSASSTTTTMNNRKGERRSWGTEELQYLGTDGSVGSTSLANSNEEKVKEKKDKKSKDKEKEKERDSEKEKLNNKEKEKDSDKHDKFLSNKPEGNTKSERHDRNEKVEKADKQEKQEKFEKYEKVEKRKKSENFIQPSMTSIKTTPPIATSNLDHQGNNTPVISAIDLLSMNTIISETAEFHVVTKKKKPKKQRASIDETHFTPASNYNNNYNYNNNNNNSNNSGITGSFQRGQNSGINSQKGSNNNGNNNGSSYGNQQQQQPQQQARYKHYNNNNAYGFNNNYGNSGSNNNTNNNNSGDSGRLDYHNNYNSNYNNNYNTNSNNHSNHSYGHQQQSQYHHHHQQQQQNQHQHQPMNAHNTSSGSTDKSRRKSTSSVPPSEKSDSSDIDSVHSLPIESTTASASKSKQQQQRQKPASSNTTTPETPKSSSSGSPGSAPISYAHIAASAAVDRWPIIDAVNNKDSNSNTTVNGSVSLNVSSNSTGEPQSQQQPINNAETTSASLSNPNSLVATASANSLSTNTTAKVNKTKKQISKPDFPELVATNTMNASITDASKSVSTPATAAAVTGVGALKNISYSQSLVAASVLVNLAANVSAASTTSVEKVSITTVEAVNMPAVAVSSHNVQDVKKIDTAINTNPTTRLPQQQPPQNPQQQQQQTLQKSKSVEHDNYSLNSTNLDQQYPALEKTVKRHSTTNVSITPATVVILPTAAAGPTGAGISSGVIAPAISNSAMATNTANAGKFNFAAAAKQFPTNKNVIGSQPTLTTTTPINTQELPPKAAQGSQLSIPTSAITTSSTNCSMAMAAPLPMLVGVSNTAIVNPTTIAATAPPPAATTARKSKEKSPTSVFAPVQLSSNTIVPTAAQSATTATITSRPPDSTNPARRTKKEKAAHQLMTAEMPSALAVGGEQLTSTAQKSSTATQTQTFSMDAIVQSSKSTRSQATFGAGNEKLVTQTLGKPQRQQPNGSGKINAAPSGTTTTTSNAAVVNRPAVIILNDDRSGDSSIEFTFGDFDEDELKFFDDNIAEKDCADEYPVAYDDDPQQEQQSSHQRQCTDVNIVTTSIEMSVSTNAAFLCESNASDADSESLPPLASQVNKNTHQSIKEPDDNQLKVRGAAEKDVSNSTDTENSADFNENVKENALGSPDTEPLQQHSQQSRSETPQLQQLETCNEIETAIIAAARAAAEHLHPQPMQAPPLPQQQQQQQRPYRHKNQQQQYRSTSYGNAYEPANQRSEHRSQSTYTRDTSNHYQPQQQHHYHNQYHPQHQQQQHNQHQQHYPYHQSSSSKSASRSRSSSSNNITNSFDASGSSPPAQRSPNPSPAVVNIQRKEFDIHFIPPTMSSAHSALQHNEIIVDFIGSAWEEVSKVTKFYEGQ